LMLGRVLRSYAYLQRVKRTAQPLTGWHQERFAAMRAASGTARRVRAAWSGEIRVPIAAGIRHPAILLPDSLAENFSPEEFDQILAHEFAHLRRWDDWTNLAQKIVEAVFFFQPAVLWAGRKLNLEREIACDDWVIAAAGNTRSYAACLTKVVELSGFARTPQLASGAGARKPQFSRRIESMLGRHMRLVNPRFSKVGICVCSTLVAAAAFGVMQFAPIAVAAPSVPALQAEFRLQHAPALGYAKPLSAPVSVAHAARLAAKPASVVAKSAAPLALVDVAVQGTLPERAQFVLVEQWTVNDSRKTAAYCVYYFSDDATVPGQAWQVARWLTVLWVHPEPERLPGDRM
ncbi:MAG: M56 family metallopeptidase, partial [Bryobacteraceae bacterium]